MITPASGERRHFLALHSRSTRSFIGSVPRRNTLIRRANLDFVDIHPDRNNAHIYRASLAVAIITTRGWTETRTSGRAAQPCPRPSHPHRFHPHPLRAVGPLVLLDPHHPRLLCAVEELKIEGRKMKVVRVTGADVGRRGRTPPSAVEGRHGTARDSPPKRSTLLFPVPRSIRIVLEDDLVREGIHWQLTRVPIGHAGYDAANIRRLFQQRKRFEYLFQEAIRQFRIAAAMPCGSISEIALRDAPKPYALHRDSTSRRTSSSAPRQSSRLDRSSAASFARSAGVSWSASRSRLSAFLVMIRRTIAPKWLRVRARSHSSCAFSRRHAV